jgi:uncharacterized protein YceH (UPF0502 family)
MTDAPAAATESTGPRWRPLERNERRVAGVLAEKAKTTPENYPLTLNALIHGCNQKSNRFPQMQLDEDQVEAALDGLRRAGAAALIQGDGRAEKYRHLLYEWLGVDKLEMAVMTELLLRGAQTMGELRGRAARMEPIRDMHELQPIVDRLRQKDLVIFLSSPGRGAVITHNLYQPQELAKLRTEHGNESTGDRPAAPPRSAGTALPPPVTGPGSSQSPPRAITASPYEPPSSPPELDQLRAEVAELKRDLAELREQSSETTAEFRRELDDLKRQLGA